MIECKRYYKCIENCNTNSLYIKWDQAIRPTRSIRKFAKNNETRVIKYEINAMNLATSCTPLQNKKVEYYNGEKNE